jgi:glycosyltransferase involved in cell wall biosynthesis
MKTLPLRPRVAVLISTYNGEAYIGEQLNSLANQDGVELDVFVRDDGSTDRTLEILKKYAERWPQLSTPLKGDNLGPAASFMTLLREIPANFDYYAFCDQDDVWLSDKLLRATLRLSEENMEKPALYCSRVLCVNQSLEPLGASKINADVRFRHLLFENVAFGNSIVMNAAARLLLSEKIPTVGLIMHDWWCTLVISALGIVVYDPEPSVWYRQHGGNVIGASPIRLNATLSQMKLFLKNPNIFYKIHAQASDLLELYGDQLSTEDRRLTEALVSSRRSLLSRIRFALSGKMVRNGIPWAVAGRVLVVAGWY